MTRSNLHFAFLNIGHFLDHFLMLVFATAAALVLTREWGLTYAQLIPYATPGFVAFAVCALPAGWLADKWSRPAMMAVFFIGLSVSTLLAGLARTPLEMAVCLTAIGAFAAIYHPVGLSLVIEGRDQTGMPLAINGVFGNLGVAAAALSTGLLIDFAGWRWAFFGPAVLTGLLGSAYTALFAAPGRMTAPAQKSDPDRQASTGYDKRVIARIFTIILITTALGGLIFQSTTFALPKVLDEKLADLAPSASAVGGYAFVVFSIAACAQLVVGFLIDRYSARYIFMVVAAIQALFLFAMAGLAGLPALAVTVVFMLAVFGQIPINDVLIGRIAAPEWRSRMFALRYIVTFSVTAATVPFIAWLHGAFGFDTLFMALAAAAAMILAAVVMLPALKPAGHAP